MRKFLLFLIATSGLIFIFSGFITVINAETDKNIVTTTSVEKNRVSVSSKSSMKEKSTSTRVMTTTTTTTTEFVKYDYQVMNVKISVPLNWSVITENKILKMVDEKKTQALEMYVGVIDPSITIEQFSALMIEKLKTYSLNFNIDFDYKEKNNELIPMSYYIDNQEVMGYFGFLIKDGLGIFITSSTAKRKYLDELHSISEKILNSVESYKSLTIKDIDIPHFISVSDIPTPENDPLISYLSATKSKWFVDNRLFGKWNYKSPVEKNNSIWEFYPDGSLIVKMENSKEEIFCRWSIKQMKDSPNDAIINIKTDNDNMFINGETEYYLNGILLMIKRIKNPGISFLINKKDQSAWYVDLPHYILRRTFE